MRADAAPSDDIVIDGAYDILYVPGGDWCPSGTDTMSGGVTFRQNGEAISYATFAQLFTVEEHAEEIDGSTDYAKKSHQGGSVPTLPHYFH